MKIAATPLIALLLTGLWMTVPVDAPAQNEARFIGLRLLHDDPIERSLEFVLYDRQGDRITDLYDADFSLTENGLPSVVTRLSCPEPNPPQSLSSVLVLDVSASMANRGRLEIARRAAGRWIDLLPLGFSEAGVISFNHRVEVLQDLTTSRSRLLASLDHLSPGGGTSWEEGLNAPVLGAIDVAARGKNKRVVVFLTDGVSSVGHQEVIRRAQQHDVEIHVVVIEMEAPESLREIARATGGLLFDSISEVSEAEDVFAVIQRIASGEEPCRLTWRRERGCERSVDLRVELPFYGLSWRKTFDIPVTALPRLFPESTGLTFGRVEIGSTRRLTLRYRAGQVPVAIESVSVPAGPYRVLSTVPTLPTRLAPGGSIDVEFEYKPTSYGFVSRRVEVSSNACGLLPLSVTGGDPGVLDGESITIVSPNGGEVFAHGQSIPIRWSGVDLADTVLLEFSRDGGTSWEILTDRATGGEWTWSAPEISSRSCLIRARLVTVGGERGMTRLRSGHRVWSVAFSPTGNLGAIASEDGVVIYCDGTTGETISVPDLPPDLVRPGHLAFSPDGRTLAITGGGPVIYLLSVTDGSVRRINVGRIASVVSYSENGDELVTVTPYGEIITLDPETGGELRRFGPQLFGTIRSLALSDYPCRVMTGGVDLIPRIFDCSTDGPGLGLPTHQLGVEAVDFSPDGAYHLTAGLDGVLRIFSQESPDRPYHESEPGPGLFAALFSPVGSRIAVGGVPARTGISPVSLLDRKTGTARRVLTGHTDIVSSIAWSPDGERILSGSWDSSAILWDLRRVPAGHDRSDETWSIVPATLALREVDFGRVRLGDVRDSVVRGLVCNDGEHPVVIDSATTSTVVYAVRSMQLPDTIGPGDCRSIELAFEPDRAGIHTGRLELHSRGTDFTTVLLGEGVDGVWIRPMIVDFGTVEVNRSRDTVLPFEIPSCGKSGTVIHEVSIEGPAAGAFSFSQPGPGVSMTDATIVSTLHFTPSYRGYQTASLLIDCSCPLWDPQRTTFEVLLYGEGMCPSEPGDLQVWLPERLEGAVGESLPIPVLIDPGTSGSTRPREFQLVLTWSRSLLASAGTTVESIDRRERTTVILEGEYDGVRDTLVTVPVIIGLGREIGTSVSIDRIVFESDCPDEARTTDGWFALDGLCPDPEMRLFIQTDSMYLRSISPDPVRTTSTISWRVIEEGEASLSVVDSRGETVRTLDAGIRGPGEYATELRRDDLPAGTYFLRLQTATQDLLRRFVVE